MGTVRRAGPTPLNAPLIPSSRNIWKVFLNKLSLYLLRPSWPWTCNRTFKTSNGAQTTVQIAPAPMKN